MRSHVRGCTPPYRARAARLRSDEKPTSSGLTPWIDAAVTTPDPPTTVGVCGIAARGAQNKAHRCGSEVHPAHAATPGRHRGHGRLFLRHFGDHRLGGHQETGDRSSIL
jgi:hypothetical protein